MWSHGRGNLVGKSLVFLWGVPANKPQLYFMCSPISCIFRHSHQQGVLNKELTLPGATIACTVPEKQPYEICIILFPLCFLLQGRKLEDKGMRNGISQQHISAPPVLVQLVHCWLTVPRSLQLPVPTSTLPVPCPPSSRIAPMCIMGVQTFPTLPCQCASAVKVGHPLRVEKE